MSFDLCYIGVVHAGFPSPAEEYMEEDIDLKKYLQPSATSIYLARVQGDSMINANIPDQSIVIIDKALKPLNHSIIVATINGERVIKRFVKTHAGMFLSSENANYKPIPIDATTNFSIWGVVTHVIVNLKIGKV